jgi:hypothetical protein
VIAPLIVAVAMHHANAQTQAAAVLRMMEAVNANVKSYQVRVHLDAKVHALLSLPLALDATYYFKQPDKVQVVFDSVPELAKQFQNFYASTGTPATWPKTYRITLAPHTPGDPPGGAVLRLVPRDAGSSLDYALITVDTATWGVVAQQWIYKDGSSINVTQFNATGGTYVLPTHQEADFHFPRYKAHVVADFGDYHINVPIPDSVFSPQQQP